MIRSTRAPLSTTGRWSSRKKWKDSTVPEPGRNGDAYGAAQSGRLIQLVQPAVDRLSPRRGSRRRQRHRRRGRGFGLTAPGAGLTSIAGGSGATC